MKKLCVLLMSLLLAAGCSSQKEPEETAPEEPAAAEADWSHLKEKIEDNHIGIDLLGWIGQDEDMNERLAEIIDDEQYAFIGELDSDRLLIGDLSDQYPKAVWLIVPNTDFTMTITVSNYDWSADEVTGILYKGDFDTPLLLVADDAMGDRNIRILAVDEENNNGEFYYYPFIDLLEPHVNTDFFMGVSDITDYDRLAESGLPFWIQGMFDRVYCLPEVQAGIKEGKTFGSLWEMGVNGHNHVIYALYDEDKGISEADAYYAVRPDDPDVWRSEDLAFWMKTGEQP